MKKKLVQQVSASFKEQFGTDAAHTILSPGRINIIGEHVDYNDGFVLPAAINKYVCFAVTENNSSKVNLYAKDLDESYSFDLNDALEPGDKMWANFFLGVAHLIKERGLTIGGVNVVFSLSLIHI